MLLKEKAYKISVRMFHLVPQNIPEEGIDSLGLKKIVNATLLNDHSINL